jgi:hypothetical protein
MTPSMRWKERVLPSTSPPVHSPSAQVRRCGTATKSPIPAAKAKTSVPASVQSESFSWDPSSS